MLTLFLLVGCFGSCGKKSDDSATDTAPVADTAPVTETAEEIEEEPAETGAETGESEQPADTAE